MLYPTNRQIRHGRRAREPVGRVLVTLLEERARGAAEREGRREDHPECGRSSASEAEPLRPPHASALGASLVTGTPQSRGTVGNAVRFRQREAPRYPGPMTPHPSGVLRIAIALTAAAVLLALPGRADTEAASAPEAAQEMGGFPLEDVRVPRAHVVGGGPGRDQIRSIDAPRFVPPGEAPWVAATTPVLGVGSGADAHIYPVHVMEYHQIVNDTIGRTPVAVTYDPLTGVPRAFERTVAGQPLEFGVAGLLYNSGFLMYDRESESLWSQMRGDAIAGPRAGAVLKRLPIRQETLAMWLEREPDSQVLVPPSEAIDYRQSRYSAYWGSPDIPSRVDARDDRYHAKEVVLGLQAGGETRAYLGSILTEAGGRITDELAGLPVEIEYWSEWAVFRWKVPDTVQVTEAYWFAWKAFHPDTEIWLPDPARAEADPD